jgi:DNA-damage-inducible protein D
MLGEASTSAIVKTKNPKGFIENRIVAKQGGKIAGDARKALEVKTGQNIITSENYLPKAKISKQIKEKKEG